MIEVFGRRTGCPRCAQLKQYCDSRKISVIYYYHNEEPQEQEYDKLYLVNRTGRNAFQLPVVFDNGKEITLEDFYAKFQPEVA